jgi:hypothetical protein
VHWASAPFTQEADPWVQLLSQVVEHIAFGAIPEQLWGGVHVDVDAT